MPTENAQLAIRVPTVNPYIRQINGVKVYDKCLIDSPGLTAQQKMQAIRLVLDDERIKNEIKAQVDSNQSNDLYVYNVSFANESERSGYSGYQGLISVQMGFGKKFWIKYYAAFVDLNDNKVIGIERWWSKNIGDIEVSLQPGLAFYHSISVTIAEANNTSNFDTKFIITYYPKDAKLYPILLDKENFEKYKKGLPYKALKYMDYTTNETILFDGSRPIVSDYVYNDNITYVANIRLGRAPSGPASDATFNALGIPLPLYIVFKNNDIRDVNITQLGTGV